MRVGERLAFSPIGRADIRLTNSAASRFVEIFARSEALAVDQARVDLHAPTCIAVNLWRTASLNSADVAN